MISNVKIERHNLFKLHEEIRRITHALKEFIAGEKHIAFEAELSELLTEFNNTYFPSPEFKYRVRRGEIDQMNYGKEKEEEFQIYFDRLVKKYDLQIRQDKSDTFLDQWYLEPVRNEIDFVFNLVRQVKDPDTKKVLAIILSRTIRSCRATKHVDLATLVEPVTSTYYCRKHGKICKPLFSILRWWERYSQDTIKRLSEFNSIRTATFQYCFIGDSRTINIFTEINNTDKPFAEYAIKHKINGIFSSPPYVGLIDYHEQHAYAYELFGFERRDEFEIGPLYKGRGKEARESYVRGISDVLINCKRFFTDDYDVFLVANDKFNLYPKIAENAGMEIVNVFKRPVLHRTEKNKMPYAETIFHLKGK